MGKKISSARPSASKSPLQTAVLLDHCRDGDEAAAAEIFARYLNRLTALAQARLSSRLAARFDADDVVMSAYRSFFIGLRDREFVIANGSELWQLLVQITLRKLYRQVARHKASKRAVGRDVMLQPGDGSWLPVPTREPQPQEVVAAAEELEHLLTQLPAAARRVVELRLQGEEIAAIAVEVRVNERTVRRWLDRARDILLARRKASGVATSSKQRSPSRGLAPTAKLRTPKSHTRRRATSRAASLFTLEYSDYVLQRMIGSGASGKVYRAMNLRDGQIYALKFLRKAFVKNRDAVDRFLAEFSLVARLRHPHLMPVFGCGQTKVGALFFAMELTQADLQQQVLKRRVPSKQAMAWFREAAAGVRYAHAQGIVHCDLKPSNLLLSGNGKVLVSDFGLASREKDLHHRWQLAGTPAFMAPEQISSTWGKMSALTDVYGLGATLYTLLTGRPPFVGKRPPDVLGQVISAAEPIAPSKLRRGVSAELSQLCLRCLAKRPEDRFPTVDALIKSLDG